MNQEEENPQVDQTPEWEAPPLPEEIVKEETPQPEMSEVGTIANIFIEPGKTFLDLRKKPRFIIAFVLIALFSTAFSIGMQQKLGEDRIRRFVTQQAEQNAQFEAMEESQKKQQIDISMVIQKVIGYALPLLLIFIFLLGGLLYFLGGKVMGGDGGFLGALSVFVYSSLPPTLVSMVLNFIVLFLKHPDEIDLATSSRGLVSANPTAFFDGKSMPVLATLISTIDVFLIWGVVLAAIGMKNVFRLSTGSAYAVVLFFTLIGIGFRVLGAFFQGIPQ